MRTGGSEESADLCLVREKPNMLVDGRLPDQAPETRHDRKNPKPPASPSQPSTPPSPPEESLEYDATAMRRAQVALWLAQGEDPQAVRNTFRVSDAETGIMTEVPSRYTAHPVRP